MSLHPTSPSPWGSSDAVGSAFGTSPQVLPTALFSPTQIHSVSDVAHLSLSRSIPIGPPIDSKDGSTPSTAQATITLSLSLVQHYTIASLNKTVLLQGFTNTHPHDKILVFLSSYKQARLVFHHLGCCWWMCRKMLTRMSVA